MPIVPKDSVRLQVALVVLVTITLSWVLSTGLANYINYLSIKSLRQTMIENPELYPQPIPEPTFGVLDFLIGRPPGAMNRTPIGSPVRQAVPTTRPEAQPAYPSPDNPELANPPPAAGGPPPPHEPPPRVFSPQEMKWVLLRLVVALALAALAAVWLGRKLTSPLAALAEGARAVHSRDFEHRVPVQGKSEFSTVARAMNDMAEEVSRHIRGLEDDAERRRRFLADVAHELRGPVTTMRTMAGALQDGVADDPERKERAVSSLVRTSERMLRLVQEVMALVELDLDRLPIEKSEVDLRGLVAAAIASHEAEAVNAGMTLHMVESGSPVVAMADADRVMQVLDNIIGNAICYAGPGASVSATVEDGDPVRIVVSDNGIGIPDGHLARILDPFYRVDTARTPGENHIGLGLSIARRIVEAHNGELSVESKEQRGTSVIIALPKEP